MSPSINERAKMHRDLMRAKGLRPLQIWVPDTRRTGFADECRRQAELVAAADKKDRELLGFLDAALEDHERDWE